jgi:translation elongation factor EF-1beta
MLKAIVTVMDENDRILDENRLIDEINSTPVGFGVRHDFHFAIVTADKEMIREALNNKEEQNE